MKVALINETSTGDRNADILAALGGRGIEIVNCGMKKSGAGPELTYIHTGFLAALLLGLKRVDFVVGGCGTGQGFMISAMQYPGVACGHIVTPLDAWLFSRINAGNCISLALNQGYGWASDVNLRFLFDAIFTQETGSGYPEARKASQAESRARLALISSATHRDFADILETLPKDLVQAALSFPGIRELIFSDSIGNARLAAVLSGLFAK